MKHYTLSRLNKVAEIKQMVPNADGEPGNSWEPGGTPTTIGTVFFGSYQLSVADTAQLNAEGTTTTRLIVVRHDKRLSTTCQLGIDGINYEVTQIQADDELNGFDVVTIRKVG